MSRKGLLTFALSLTVSAIAIAVAPGTVANAQSLTQVTNTQKISYSYGALNQATKDALTSMFDAEFYASENPQVVEAVGNSPAALLQHWLENGIWEGRPGNATFDPSAYASANQDLKDAFGDNIIQYYIFYLDNKDDPARQITTVEQCITNGITVTSVIDTDIVITPQVYWTAKYLGTNDIRRISYHISQAEAAVEATGEEAVIELGELDEINHGVTLTLKRNEAGYFEIYLNDSKTSYGAYLTYTTDNSKPAPNAVWELVAGEDIKNSEGRIKVISDSSSIKNNGNSTHTHFYSSADATVASENDSNNGRNPNQVCIWHHDLPSTDENTFDVYFTPEKNSAGEITTININIDMEATSEAITEPISDTTSDTISDTTSDTTSDTIVIDTTKVNTTSDKGPVG